MIYVAPSYLRTTLVVMPRSVQAFGPTSERHFWKRVERPTDANACWLWTGRRTKWGYGEFTFTAFDGTARHIKAHRASYELLRGPIPDDAPLDHQCEVRLCVNPDHLKPVTPRQNNYRMLTRKSGGRDLRIPDALWETAQAAAALHGRSLQADILHWFERYAQQASDSSAPTELSQQLAMFG